MYNDYITLYNSLTVHFFFLQSNVGIMAMIDEECMRPGQVYINAKTYDSQQPRN